MNREEIRLECIKLAVMRTQNHADGVARAEDYFGFVMKSEDDALQKDLLKKVGNSVPQNRPGSKE